jgi:hypothetical protein
MAYYLQFLKMWLTKKTGGAKMKIKRVRRVRTLRGTPVNIQCGGRYELKSFHNFTTVIRTGNKKADKFFTKVFQGLNALDDIIHALLY